MGIASRAASALGSTQSRWVPSLTVDSKLPAAPAGLGQSAPEPADRIGLLFGRLTVLPSLLTLPFLLTSFPLLLLGWFKPAPVIVLWLLLTAVAVPFAWRRIPSLAGAPDFGTPSDGRIKKTPRWTLISVAVIAVVFGIWQAAYHSQFIIVMLDPASYMMFANWIAHHGSLPIPTDAQAFGGAHNITFNSAAFYNGPQYAGASNAIVPQFMAGLPMILSVGYWAGGVRLALFWGPVLGAAAVFVFGGLAARLIGPRWAPLAALTLAITLPEQYTSRSTFSETLAQILFLGALSLWIDTQRTDRGAEDAGRFRTHWRSHARSATHVLAFITGLLFGITLLVRLDGPSDILLLVPYCGMLVLTRQRQVLPLVVGTFIGLLYGTVDGVALTRPYLDTNSSSVRPLVEIFAFLTVVTAIAVLWLRRHPRTLPLRHPRVLKATAILPFVVVAIFVIRPYVERNWHALQYAPLSLHWIEWYTGAPIILLATIATAVLAPKCIKGEARVWVLPLLLFSWCIVEFLLRPAITPHQPWASRRLVPAVIPGLILFSVWLVAWAARRSRVIRMVNVPRYLERLPRSALVAVCSLAIFLPPAIDTFGIGIKGTSSGAASLSFNGLAFKRTYVGEVAAIEKICEGIPANSSVLIIDNDMMTEFGETIRGMCNVPVAAPIKVTSANLAADVRAIEHTGRHPIVLAPSPNELAILGNGMVKRIMTQYTTIDEHLVFGTPQNPLPQRFAAYSWEPAQ
jgi:hypothetical protein